MGDSNADTLEIHTGNDSAADILAETRWLPPPGKILAVAIVILQRLQHELPASTQRRRRQPGRAFFNDRYSSNGLERDALIILAVRLCRAEGNLQAQQEVWKRVVEMATYESRDYGIQVMAYEDLIRAVLAAVEAVYPDVDTLDWMDRDALLEAVVAVTPRPGAA